MNGITVIANKLFFKAGFTIAFALAVYLIGSENISAFKAVVALCLLDFTTAMYVLYRKGKSVASKKFPNKLGSIAKYAVIIMAMNLLSRVNPSFTFLVDMAMGWAAATEVLSLLEHLSALGIKVPIPLLNNLKKIQDGEK